MSTQTHNNHRLHVVENVKSLIFVCLVLALILFIGLWQKNISHEANYWVQHTIEVKAQLTELLSVMQDAETGQRGFVITGKEEYLEPFNSAHQEIDGTIEQFKFLTRDNPTQQQHIDDVHDLVVQKFAELEETIELRRNHGFEASAKVVHTDLGKEIMDTIRSKIDIMSVIEDDLLITRNEHVMFWQKMGLFIQITALIFLISAIVIFLKEMTAGFKQNEALIHSLEETNSELEEFAYRTSHDLRSPLISSIKLLQLAEKYMNEGKQDKASKAFQHVSVSLAKLETLVNDILCLTRVSKEKEEKQPTNITQLVDDTLNKLSHYDNFDRITIDKQISYQGTLELQKSRMQLIVENLISNAVKYQDLDEVQSIITITSKLENDTYRFIVEDNGLGIPEEYQDQLFSMFKRFHTKTSSGTGLGLYMIKKSAHILDGDIRFEPLDKGTRFIFEMSAPKAA